MFINQKTDLHYLVFHPTQIIVLQVRRIKIGV